MCAWLGSLHKVSHEKTQNVEPFPEKSMRFFISSTKSKRSTGFSAGNQMPTVKTLDPVSKLQKAISSALFPHLLLGFILHRCVLWE